MRDVCMSPYKYMDAPSSRCQVVTDACIIVVCVYVRVCVCVCVHLHFHLCLVCEHVHVDVWGCVWMCVDAPSARYQVDERCASRPQMTG